MSQPRRAVPPVDSADDLALSYKVFHELMARKVADILLVSSPYDAFIMEEEGRLAERIILEYRGLNLSRPPRLTWVSTAQEALQALSQKRFDMVITMPRLDDMDAYALGRAVKARDPLLPVFMLTHSTHPLLLDSAPTDKTSIDKRFVWIGNSDLLLALIKSVEDRWNIGFDTSRARVRVIIMVEDSPLYCSSLLPMLYKEIVMQTQRVMEESLNDEHRLFRMRGRPKILTAETFEEAEALYNEYKPYLLCVLSDVRFPRAGHIDPEAGFALLRRIRAERPDLPLLNFSSEEHNRRVAAAVPAVFLNKNSPTLLAEIRDFFVQHCGFGPFVFRDAEDREVGRAENLRAMEKVLAEIPDAVVRAHARRNDFSSWLMARGEILLATQLKPVMVDDFATIDELKHYLIEIIRHRRKGQQRGVITELGAGGYDPDADFVKVGKGSLGGKARGLAFITTQLRGMNRLQAKFPQVTISVPTSLVISTEGFDALLLENDLKDLSDSALDDAQIAALFTRARMPAWIDQALTAFLEQADYPLAVRSSSLLEDAMFQPYAGIYHTYMLPNCHPDPAQRLERLGQAVRQVYASTFMSTPRAYARNTMHRTEDEKMAVIVQQLVGRRCGRYFYPGLAGVARSVNHYPVGPMRPEEGIAVIALGLGKTVVDGGKALRFSPRYPQHLPQFSTVEDILDNAQRYFYALRMDEFPEILLGDDATLVRLEVDTALDHPAVRYLAGCYNPSDHRIRDTPVCNDGYPVITCARLLKYGDFPLPELLQEVLEIGRRGMGGPVEIEFAVNLAESGDARPEFALLQVRPMGIGRHQQEVRIDAVDIDRAFCHSCQALGNGVTDNIADIVYVRPATFDPGRTVEIAAEIGTINGRLAAADRPYLLVGPGRWGTADRWLGIPVDWHQISAVGAIVETSMDGMKADPSQGSHFFNNITSLGIGYLTVTDCEHGHIDWPWLEAQPAAAEARYVRHLQLKRPLAIKIDGKSSRAAIIVEPGGPP